MGTLNCTTRPFIPNGLPRQPRRLPKRFQEVLKIARGAIKTAQETPMASNRVQEVPWTAQGAPERPRRRPEGPPSSSQDGPRGPKALQRDQLSSLRPKTPMCKHHDTS